MKTMAEKKESDKGPAHKKMEIERRSGKDRRTGKLNDKFKYSVEMGFFLEMRRGERRRRDPIDKISFN